MSLFVHNLTKSKSYSSIKQIVPQQINSINICVPMTQKSSSQYNFCTLNQLNTPKPLPPLEFVTKLLEICYVPNTLFESQQKNIYDRKNHTLYINNYQAYSKALREKCGRSVASFEKQLKMMGFKKRIIKQHGQQTLKSIKNDQSQQINNQIFMVDKKETNMEEKTDNVFVEQQKNNRNFTQTLQQQINYHQKYMFTWKTNRTNLIEKQIHLFEQTLSLQIEKALQLKFQMEKTKKQLDSRLQTVLFKTLISQNYLEINQNLINCDRNPFQNSQKVDNFMKHSIKELKNLVNHCQIQSKDLITNFSLNSSNELQLYRTLIFKQAKIHNASQIDQE